MEHKQLIAMFLTSVLTFSTPAYAGFGASGLSTGGAALWGSSTPAVTAAPGTACAPKDRIIGTFSELDVKRTGSIGQKDYEKSGNTVPFSSIDTKGLGRITQKEFDAYNRKVGCPVPK